MARYRPSTAGRGHTVGHGELAGHGDRAELVGRRELSGQGEMVGRGGPSGRDDPLVLDDLGGLGDLVASGGLVGRDDLVARAERATAGGGSIVLSGPAGIGKSTILDAITATTDGVVLRASAAEAEADLPYLALVDLFDGAPAAALDTLAPHLRAALDGALLHTALPSTPHDQLAVRLAVLELLRAMSAERPIVLVLDDTQWIDEPSAGVLRFVARRLDAAQVRVLAAERVADGAATCQALCPPPCLELAVPPLPEVAVVDLLRARFGTRVSLAQAQRVYRVSGGNPLYAVELGRALLLRAERVPPTEPLPVPDRLRSLLAARIAKLPAADQAALLTVAVAARPNRALLERVGIGLDEGLAGAVRAGVLAIDPESGVRFTHPLLREMVVADAEPALRRAVHERLAAAVADPVERARHLAAARQEPDEALAESLAAAAAAAALRGAPAVAADLARLAAERTPPAGAGTMAVRWLAAARYAYAAGVPADAQIHAQAALRYAEDVRTRVGARLFLVELAGEDHSGTGPLLDAAFREAARIPDLMAHVRLYRAVKAHYDGDTDRALVELEYAEEAAERCGDAERLVEVLSWRGNILPGREADELFERAAHLARGLSLTSAGVVGARQLGAMGRLFRGDVAEAVRRIEALRTAVEETGTVRALAQVLVSVAGIYGRAGRCRDALLAGRACARLYVDVETTPGPGLLSGAMAELNGGTVERAAEYAEQATQACLAAGDEDWIKLAYVTGGMVSLLRGNHEAAASVMRRAYELDRRRGRADPGELLWHADFVEALVGTGARAEAAEVLADVRRETERLGRRLAQLGLARAGALVMAASGDVREAAQSLAVALERWADHPYPLEVARAWYVLGGLERRAHRRAAARAALTEAVRRYAAAEAVPWREAAATALARLDGSRGGGLSETERRIVELVRAGATNREIARALYLSVKAVEANLTRLYRRLNVRNRGQLAREFDDIL